MELNKFNTILTDKPKIINTLSAFCRSDPSNLAILNEYRTKGSDILRPIGSKNIEKRKKLTAKEPVERKNKHLANISEKYEEKKRPKYLISAHSTSPKTNNNNKPVRLQLKSLEKIYETVGSGPKLDFILKGTRSKLIKLPEVKNVANIKEKKKENAQETVFFPYKVTFEFSLLFYKNL